MQERNRSWLTYSGAIGTPDGKPPEQTAFYTTQEKPFCFKPTF